MSKIIAVPSNSNQLEKLLDLDIDAILFSIKDLSVNSNYFIDIEYLTRIIPKIKTKNIKILVSLNKIMHNYDIPILTNTLLKLNDLDIDKILFYDLSIIELKEKLNIKKELVISNEHSNASIYSNQFYLDYNINTCLITSDITLEEVKEIKSNTKMQIILPVYGHVPIMYSRRYLLTNYFEYIKQEKKNPYYYIKDKDTTVIVKEEPFGTSIYNNEVLNLDKEFFENKELLDYIILYSEFIDDDEYISTIKYYIDIEADKVKTFESNYKGFSYDKTIYKVKDDV